jgi:hypothetical protein
VILLVHPPAARPSEPPAGLFRLSAALSLAGVNHDILDLNLESLLWAMERQSSGGAAAGAWSQRAQRNLGQNLALLRSPGATAGFDRYSRAVLELERLLADFSPGGWSLSLCNTRHHRLSPLRSADLLYAADHPEEDPYFPFFSARLSGMLGRGCHRIAGFSINYLGQGLSAFAMIGFIRREMPGIRIVAGGGLVSSWMAMYDLPRIFGALVDSFVRGPGEEALVRMALEAGPDRAPFTAAPAWPQGYISPGPILPASTSSGCFWNRCSFCPERAEGNTYTPAVPASAAAGTAALAGRFRPALVPFTDNALSPATLRAIASNPPGAPWYGFARVSPELADAGLCTALKESGCVMLKLGVESGSDHVLWSMNKGFDTALSGRVLSSLTAAGIATYVYMLFGTPQETPADAGMSLDFCAANAGSIRFLNLAIFNMPAFGPDIGTVSTRPFYDADLGLYTDFDHPAGWDRRSVRTFIEKTFSRHPAMAPIIRRDPPVFTSSHAPFFCDHG